MTHYLILTRFDYNEPGHSSSCILPYEAVNYSFDELPRLYQTWMKSHVIDEGVNERHYGRKTVKGVYEVTTLPTQAFQAAIKAAYAEVEAAENAVEVAEVEQATADTETREREEFARLSAKFAKPGFQS
jgi:hypothetical protein